MEIHLTAILKSKEEFTEKVKELLENLVEASRKESGCLQFDLHQNIENPNIFILHETWQNKEIFEIHNSQPYVVTFFEMTPNLLEGNPEVFFTNKLD